MRGAPPQSDGTRGQTTLDFVVGIGVFLLVMGFAAGFVPEMYASFDDDPQRGLVADRTADRVVGTLVTDDGSPSVLNETCASAFLRQSGSVCGFDTANPLHEQVGIGPRYRLNVSLRRDTGSDPGLETLCHDGSDVTDCAGGGTALAVGPAVPSDRSSVDSARRLVHVDGRDATVVVTVW